MSKLLDTALGFLGINVHQLIVTAALLFAAFFAGAAWQNGHATQTAIAAVQTAADKRVADDRRDYNAKLADAKKRLEDQRGKQQEADQKSHDQLVHERDSARAAYDRAMAQLKKGSTNAVYARDDLIVGGPDMRRLFDNTAAACTDAGSADAAANLPGRADGPAPACGPAADLRLGELKAGYLALGKRLREVRGLALSLQTEARSLGLAPPMAPQTAKP